MTQDNNDLQEIKQLLVGFIKEQRDFNKSVDERFQKIDERFQKIDEQFQKIDEQFQKIDEQFQKIDEQFQKVYKVMDEKFEKVYQKMDKVQYFLEENIAENTKVLFEEQENIKSHVKEVEKSMKSKTSDLGNRVTVLFKAVSAM